MNHVSLIGRLCKDPELRTTTTGKYVTSFTLAVGKDRKVEEGEKDADFIRCKAWGQTAEFIANYLHKGRLIVLMGRIETKSYTDSEDRHKEITEVVASSVKSLDRPRDKQPDPSPTKEGEVDEEFDPFAE